MSRATRLALLAVAVLLPACQQRMAKQPYYRPLDQTPFFADGRASRPLEPGVFVRGQKLDSDPLVSGLTADARKLVANGAMAIGVEPPPAPAPGTAATTPPQPGAPSDVKNFVTDFPFELTEADLTRGATRYAVFCTPCHGPLGNGYGKIVERGYLRPTSFHKKVVDPAHEKPYPGDPGYVEAGDVTKLPRGYSRGFDRWGKKVALEDAPNGYFYEVITHGYGGMPAYNEQIPPEDRWRIIAYIRALQYSQGGVSADDAKRLKDAHDKAHGEQPAHGAGGHK